MGMLDIYHTGTDQVASWLVLTADLIGLKGPVPPKPAPSTAAPSRKDRKYEIQSVRAILELSAFIAEHWHRYGPFPRLRYVLRQLDNAIDFRTHVTQRYKLLPGGKEKKASDEGHQHFVNVLCQVREQLRSCLTPPPATGGTQTDPGRGLENRFQALCISGNSSSSSSSSSASASDGGAEDDDEAPIEVTHRLEVAIDDDDRHLLVLCAVQDVSAGIEHIALVWELAKSHQIDEGTAALATEALISINSKTVRKCDEQLAAAAGGADVASILQDLASDDGTGGALGAFASAAELLGRLHPELLPRLKAGQWPTDLWGGQQEAEEPHRPLELLCATVAVVLLMAEGDGRAEQRGLKPAAGNCRPFLIRDPLTCAVRNFIDEGRVSFEICFILAVYIHIDRITKLTTDQSDAYQVTRCCRQMNRLRESLEWNQTSGPAPQRVPEEFVRNIEILMGDVAVMAMDPSHYHEVQNPLAARHRVATLNPQYAALNVLRCLWSSMEGQRWIDMMSMPPLRGLAQLYDAGQKGDMPMGIWHDVEMIMDEYGVGTILGSRAQRDAPGNEPLKSILLASDVPAKDLRGPVSTWAMEGGILGKVKILGWQTNVKKSVTEQCLEPSLGLRAREWEAKNVKRMAETAGWNYRDYKSENRRVLQSTAPTSFPRRLRVDAAFSRPGPADRVIHLPVGFPPEIAVLMAIWEKERIRTEFPYGNVQKWLSDIASHFRPDLLSSSLIWLVIRAMYDDAMVAEANGEVGRGEQPHVRLLAKKLNRLIVTGDVTLIEPEWIGLYSQHIVVQIGGEEDDVIYAVARSAPWYRVDNTE